MNYLEPSNDPNFRDTVPYPNEIPIERDGTYNDPTAVDEIEQAIIDGYKDDIAVKYAQFIRGKMYGTDVRESIARFDLWLDVRVNSIDAKGNQINSDYEKIQKELEDFRKQFEIVISAQTIDGEVKLARHSLFSGKTFDSLKSRLDYMEEELHTEIDWLSKEHYLQMHGSVTTTRTLIDDNFSKNHTVTVVGQADEPNDDNPIVVATIDDATQNRFKFVEVGD